MIEKGLNEQLSIAKGTRDTISQNRDLKLSSKLKNLQQNPIKKSIYIYYNITTNLENCQYHMF